LTSPKDQLRMSSAVARPMRSSSKKLTSST
jgi:hypothetical protein